MSQKDEERGKKVTLAEYRERRAAKNRAGGGGAAPPRFYPAELDTQRRLQVTKALGLFNEHGVLTQTDVCELIKLCGYELSYNEVLLRYENDKEPVNEALAGRIKSDLREIGELCGLREIQRTLSNRAIVEDAVTTLFYGNTYHPIKDYLHDAYKEHLRPKFRRPGAFDELCQHFGDEHGVFPLFLRRFLLGCVGRVRDAFQNYTLILGGAQNLGKSTFCRWLCEGVGLAYFQEGPILPNEKDHRLRLAKKWIWAVDEFGETLSRSSQCALKAFLTQDAVSERPPYAKHEILLPRNCNIIATTNDDRYLKDITGNRRYLTVKLTKVDRRYSARVTPKELWAEVVSWYQAGERAELTEDEVREQELSNAAAEEEDSLADFLEDLLERADDGAVDQPDVYARVFARFSAHGDRHEENVLRAATRKYLTHKLGAKSGRCHRCRTFTGVRLRQLGGGSGVRTAGDRLLTTSAGVDDFGLLENDLC